MSDALAFWPPVAEKLGYYVYALRDPRPTHGIFYVGKGKGNRVYQHAREASKVDGESSKSLKLDTINEIRDQGYQVGVEIIRHKLTESEAFEIEAAVIDTLRRINVLQLTDSELANRAGGQHSRAQGWMSLDELHARYGAKPLDLSDPHVKQDNLMFIKINKLYRPDMSPEELYEATRKAWVRAEWRKPELALAVYHGIVRAVYRIDKWERCPKPHDKRWAFTGKVASDRVDDYVWRDVRHIVDKVQNPICYYNC